MNRNWNIISWIAVTLLILIYTCGIHAFSAIGQEAQISQETHPFSFHPAHQNALLTERLSFPGRDFIRNAPVDRGSKTQGVYPSSGSRRSYSGRKRHYDSGQDGKVRRFKRQVLPAEQHMTWNFHPDNRNPPSAKRSPISHKNSPVVIRKAGAISAGPSHQGGANVPPQQVTDPPYQVSPPSQVTWLSEPPKNTNVQASSPGAATIPEITRMLVQQGQINTLPSNNVQKQSSSVIDAFFPQVKQFPSQSNISPLLDNNSAKPTINKIGNSLSPSGPANKMGPHMMPHVQEQMVTPTTQIPHHSHQGTGTAQLMPQNPAPSQGGERMVAGWQPQASKSSGPVQQNPQNVMLGNEVHRGLQVPMDNPGLIPNTANPRGESGKNSLLVQKAPPKSQAGPVVIDSFRLPTSEIIRLEQRNPVTSIIGAKNIARVLPSKVHTSGFHPQSQVHRNKLLSSGGTKHQQMLGHEQKHSAAGQQHNPTNNISPITNNLNNGKVVSNQAITGPGVQGQQQNAQHRSKTGQNGQRQGDLILSVPNVVSPIHEGVHHGTSAQLAPTHGIHRTGPIQSQGNNAAEMPQPLSAGSSKPGIAPSQSQENQNQMMLSVLPPKTIPQQSVRGILPPKQPVLPRPAQQLGPLVKHAGQGNVLNSFATNSVHSEIVRPLEQKQTSIMNTMETLNPPVYPVSKGDIYRQIQGLTIKDLAYTNFTRAQILNALSNNLRRTDTTGQQTKKVTQSQQNQEFGPNNPATFSNNQVPSKQPGTTGVFSKSVNNVVPTQTVRANRGGNQFDQSVHMANNGHVQDITSDQFPSAESTRSQAGLKQTAGTQFLATNTLPSFLGKQFKLRPQISPPVIQPTLSSGNTQNQDQPINKAGSTHWNSGVNSISQKSPNSASSGGLQRNPSNNFGQNTEPVSQLLGQSAPRNMLDQSWTHDRHIKQALGQPNQQNNQINVKNGQNVPQNINQQAFGQTNPNKSILLTKNILSNAQDVQSKVAQPPANGFIGERNFQAQERPNPKGRNAGLGVSPKPQQQSFGNPRHHSASPNLQQSFGNDKLNRVGIDGKSVRDTFQNTNVVNRADKAIKQPNQSGRGGIRAGQDRNNMEHSRNTQAKNGSPLKSVGGVLVKHWFFPEMANMFSSVVSTVPTTLIPSTPKPSPSLVDQTPSRNGRRPSGKGRPRSGKRRRIKGRRRANRGKGRRVRNRSRQSQTAINGSQPNKSRQSSATITDSVGTRPRQSPTTINNSIPNRSRKSSTAINNSVPHRSRQSSATINRSVPSRSRQSPMTINSSIPNRSRKPPTINNSVGNRSRQPPISNDSVGNRSRQPPVTMNDSVGNRSRQPPVTINEPVDNMSRHPPTNINDSVGYRSRHSPTNINDSVGYRSRHSPMTSNDSVSNRRRQMPKTINRSIEKTNALDKTDSKQESKLKRRKLNITKETRIITRPLVSSANVQTNALLSQIMKELRKSAPTPSPLNQDINAKLSQILNLLQSKPNAVQAFDSGPSTSLLGLTQLLGGVSTVGPTNNGLPSNSNQVSQLSPLEMLFMTNMIQGGGSSGSSAGGNLDLAQILLGPSGNGALLAGKNSTGLQGQGSTNTTLLQELLVQAIQSNDNNNNGCGCYPKALGCPNELFPRRGRGAMACKKDEISCCDDN